MSASPRSCSCLRQPLHHIAILGGASSRIANRHVNCHRFVLPTIQLRDETVPTPRGVVHTLNQNKAQASTSRAPHHTRHRFTAALPRSTDKRHIAHRASRQISSGVGTRRLSAFRANLHRHQSEKLATPTPATDHPICVITRHWNVSDRTSSSWALSSPDRPWLRA